VRFIAPGHPDRRVRHPSRQAPHYSDKLSAEKFEHHAREQPSAKNWVALGEKERAFATILH
jgi:hypothetical protein